MKQVQKCNLKTMEFCAPMLAHSMGKFADGTLQVVSKIDPGSGREQFAHEIVFSHNGPTWPDWSEPRRGAFTRLVERIGGHATPKRTPRPLRFNFCPWCGASLAEPERQEP